MMEAIRLMARYNAHVNEDVNSILSSLTPEDWTKERGGFYPTLQKLLSHIYSADLAWLVRFTGLRAFPSLKGDPFDFPPAPGTVVFESFAAYLEQRKVLDAAAIAFAAELTASDLAADLSYRNFRGEPYTKNFGGLVLHMFNHATHHRGMLALWLDQAGVKNDFSNLSNIV